MQSTYQRDVSGRRTYFEWYLLAILTKKLSLPEGYSYLMVSGFPGFRTDHISCGRWVCCLDAVVAPVGYRLLVTLGRSVVLDTFDIATVSYSFSIKLCPVGILGLGTIYTFLRLLQWTISYIVTIIHTIFLCDTR